MKPFYFIKNNLFLLVVLMSSSVFAQLIHDPNNIPYVGSWQYQNGNIIFKLIIQEDQTPNPYDNTYYLSGHYEMSTVINGFKTIIYTSNPQISPNQINLWAFYGSIMTNDENTTLLGGVFREIHKGGTGLPGDFTIVKLPSCSGCPQKIFWKVTKVRGVTFYPGKTPPTDFTIPNNIELTKVP